MEQRKVILNENKSVKSTNQTNNISVNFDANLRLLPYGDINEKLSLYRLYTEERDNCETYRMIFTVNPLCTNVLYNMRTEIVRNEGSSACTSLTYGTGYLPSSASNKTILDWWEGIRDSEFTHKGLFKNENLGVFKTREPYVYHCGADIFNNHLLRSEEFTYVSWTKELNNKDFNTLTDFIRDKNGDTVLEKISIDDVERYTSMHLYRYDSILSLYDAYRNKLNEENGWYGFTNPGNVEIPNIKISSDEWISANRLMNNNKACEFIDLYPDRSLFSFIPKVNKFRNRLEYNWDYDIMYPFESDIKMLNKVCRIKEDLSENNGGGAIKIIEAKQSYTNSGTYLVRFKTMFKHTLKSGDYIRLYYKSWTTRSGEPEDTEPDRFSSRIKVVSCGDEYGLDKDRYFSINYSDISSKFGFNSIGILRSRNDDLSLDGTKSVTFFYKKEVNGYECRYYFRKFRKVSENELSSEINKLAYGENIYGDRMAQIVFTDDINIGGLVDNLGMPLKEVYLVFFKTNRGYKEWYDNRNTTGETIEFSHCFGELTSGLDLPVECKDYNVRKLHNIDISKITDTDYSTGTNMVFGSLKPIPKCIESDITKNGYGETGIYGDVVEFDKTTFKETVIENVYHRFNTAQRECTLNKYFDINDEEIIYDDYDEGVNDSSRNGFEARVTQLNKVTSEGNDYKFAGNLCPEGYYYNPKTKIKLKELSEDLSESITKIIKFKDLSDVQNFETVTYYLTVEGVTEREEDGEIDEYGDAVKYWKMTLTCATKYDWIKNDTLYFYDNENNKTIIGTVVGFNENDNTIDVVVELGTLVYQKLTGGTYTIVTNRDNIPQYAEFLPNSRKFVWRNLLNMSELTSDNELFDMPFSNGCLYIHKNVNFFLKRQDPRGDFGLLYPEEVATDTQYYRKPGWEEYDRTDIQCIDDSINNICY